VSEQSMLEFSMGCMANLIDRLPHAGVSPVAKLTAARTSAERPARDLSTLESHVRESDALRGASDVRAACRRAGVAWAPSAVGVSTRVL
jgi:hypothetical protein